jgi:peroxiredoxin Q/BCP
MSIILKKGDKAPEFKLPDKDGKKISLKDYRGKWVIVYFYPKDDTPGCTIEAREFTKSIDDFAKLDAVILGISGDTAESHIKFTEKYGLKITLLSDEDHNVMENFGAWGIKKMFGKEYWGVIRSTFLIDPDGNIAAPWYKVQVKGHVDDVKKVLSEGKD